MAGRGDVVRWVTVRGKRIPITVPRGRRPAAAGPSPGADDEKVVQAVGEPVDPRELDHPSVELARSVAALAILGQVVDSYDPSAAIEHAAAALGVDERAVSRCEDVLAELLQRGEEVPADVAREFVDWFRQYDVGGGFTELYNYPLYIIPLEGNRVFVYDYPGQVAVVADQDAIRQAVADLPKQLQQLDPGEALTVADEAIGWSQVGFDYAEARQWQQSGFTDPYEAQRWRDAGYTPEEAAEMVERGYWDPDNVPSR